MLAARKAADAAKEPSGFTKMLNRLVNGKTPEEVKEAADKKAVLNERKLLAAQELEKASLAQVEADKNLIIARQNAVQKVRMAQEAASNVAELEK